MRSRLILFCFFILSFSPLFSGITTKHSSSTLEIDAGANFVIESVIEDFQGKLVKQPSASITGNAINFSDGSFEDAGNKIKISGSLSPETSSEVILDGYKVFKGLSKTSFYNER